MSTNATTRSLRITFEDDMGDDMSVTYAGIKEDPQVTEMKAVYEALIANKEAFVNAPTTMKKVDYITTNTREFEPEDFEV